MIAEADVTDGTNVVNTEPKEKTEPRMDTVIDVKVKKETKEAPGKLAM